MLKDFKERIKKKTIQTTGWKEFTLQNKKHVKVAVKKVDEISKDEKNYREGKQKKNVKRKELERGKTMESHSIA